MAIEWSTIQPGADLENILSVEPGAIATARKYRPYAARKFANYVRIDGSVLTLSINQLI
jgi:hypothetical protein